jgi:hypothetical protein
MTEFESQVLQELSVLKMQMQMQQLMGIGQPGRLNQLESRVDSHEQSMQRLKGLGSAIGALVTFVHVAIVFWMERHR